MNSFLLVFLGAGLGGALRHAVNVASLRLVGAGFPWGTLFVNVTGSLAMGLVVGYFATRSQADGAWRLFLTTGLLGGFTTFSAFSLDAVLLYQRGEIAQMILYVTGSVAASVAALALGLFIARVV